MKSLLKIIWQQKVTRYNLLAAIASFVIIHIAKNSFLYNTGMTCFVFLFSYWTGLALIRGLNYSFSDIKNGFIKQILYTIILILVIAIYIYYLSLFLIALYEYRVNVVPIFFKINSFLVASFIVLYNTAIKTHTSLIFLGGFIAFILIVFSFTVGCALEESENTAFYQTEIYNQKNVNKNTNNEFPLRTVALATIKGGAALASWDFAKINNLNTKTLVILLISCVEYWIFNVLVIGALVSTIKLKN